MLKIKDLAFNVDLERSEVWCIHIQLSEQFEDDSAA